MKKKYVTWKNTLAGAAILIALAIGYKTTYEAGVYAASIEHEQCIEQYRE